jgi:hypothetical protein
MHAAHGQETEKNTKVLHRVMKPLTEVKIGKSRAQDDNHSFPHGPDPEHVSVAETFGQKVDDSDVPKNPQEQIFVPVRLCVPLDIEVAKDFSQGHTTHIQECHFISIDK